MCLIGTGLRVARMSCLRGGLPVRLTANWLRVPWRLAELGEGEHAVDGALGPKGCGCV